MKPLNVNERKTVLSVIRVMITAMGLEINPDDIAPYVLAAIHNPEAHLDKLTEKINNMRPEPDDDYHD